MLFATGDTHGDFDRFKPENFFEAEEITRDDYVLICGDFGGVWSGSSKESKILDWLENMPFTTLFVDGNHENFELLYSLPEMAWKGGRVHIVRPHILHLMRGQVYEIEGRRFFTMGGARSHDIQDGILDPKSPTFKEDYQALRMMYGMFRVKGVSWWSEELPSKDEYAEAWRNLESMNFSVDFVISHCCPTSIQGLIDPHYKRDDLTDFLDEVRERTSFDQWLFGHYHDNKRFYTNYTLLYEQIVQVL